VNKRKRKIFFQKNKILILLILSTKYSIISKPDFDTIPFIGVLYWVSLVFDLTGVLGGMKTMSLLDAALELCPVWASDLAASLSLAILKSIQTITFIS